MNPDIQQKVFDLTEAIKEVDFETVELLIKDLLKGDDKRVIQKVIVELSKIDQNLIEALSYYLSRNIDTINEVPVLQEILFAKILVSPSTIIDLLEKTDDAEERKFYVYVIGELRIEMAIPVLEKQLARTTSESYIVFIIKALGKVGDAADARMISDFLYAPSRSLITEAIRALGAIGSHTAIKQLAERMGTDAEFDSIIIDQFAKVQDHLSIEKLNETMASHTAHIRTYGKTKLIDIGPKVLPVILENLVSDDSDFVIHTLNVLAEMDDESAIKPIRDLLHSEPHDANVRFAAYEALGKLPFQKVAYALADGLNDPIDNVRVAAAKAINNNYSEVLGAGVKNLIHSSAFNSDEIISAIVESESDHIFMTLIGDDDFKERIFTYIREQAHAEVVKFFTVILTKNNQAELVLELQNVIEKESTEVLIYAVDDSRMILNIYRSALHKLGFECKLFEFPETVLQQVESDRPKLIFTDLNMPVYSGIDLTKELRKTYTKDELPIVMVTTQSDIQDKNAATDAGVNIVLNKPFTPDDLKEALNQFGL
ncbi:MAG: response regulator [Fibrobacterales bacterium]